jgi:hypothetical protein
LGKELWLKKSRAFLRSSAYWTCSGVKGLLLKKRSTFLWSSVYWTGVRVKS